MLLLAFTPIVKSTAQVNPVKVAQADTTIIEQLKDDVSDNIPVISLDENDAQDGSAQNVSSMLTAGRDPFFNAASFKFGAARFRIRGYDADQFGTYMNGSPMENLDNGFTPYGLWGGLNEVLRNRDNSLGLKATPYAFGDLGGLNNLDTRASYQRAQTSINYAISNRNYSNRVMFTHSTGLNKKGWAYSFSVSRRWADEGFTDGTFYNAWSFYAAADKRLNAKNLFSIVAFATPTENGRQGASVAEMRNLSGTNYYNPYWGYQNGVKRNASIARSFQPFVILSHEWKPNDKTTLLSSASLTHGDRSTTGLDWYNAADPRPDYYRYLPSYQEDPNNRSQVYNAMKNNINLRQINWDALYNANYNSYEQVQNANGRYVSPDDLTFAAAAAGADWFSVPGMGVSMVNAKGDASWPISTASFILMYKNPADKAASNEALKFFDWSFKNGKKMAADLDYVPLPDSLTNEIRAKVWSQIQK
jgi:hypothetical protein